VPGADLEYPAGSEGPDLYPATQEEHQLLLAWCLDAFTAAQSAKQARETKWRKFHRIYRSYIERDQVASWRSAMFVPYTFSSIEAMVPRLVAQLPRFVCEPVGPEDVIPAKLMEDELARCAEQTHLRVELIKGVKTCLKYGTGILKNYYHEDVRYRNIQQPVMEQVPVEQDVPVTDPETGAEVRDLDGIPEVTREVVGYEEQPQIGPDGQPVMEWIKEPFLIYSGPKSTWVDPFHFWVAPEATDLDDARYTIERFYREQTYIAQKMREGVYQLPDGISTIEETFPEEESTELRDREIGQGGNTDSTRKPVELLEFHTNDNRVITVMNKKAVIRVAENPYWHGEKPYAMWPDYMQEGEIWGIGEVEAIEGLQDLVNAMYNQRIDNVRLGMDKMVVVNTKAIEEERDLVWRPGGVIRTVGDFLPEEAVQVLELGDVTASAFQEADRLEALIERTTGIGGYQLGQVEEGQNRTATGVSLITEAGTTKFAMKVQLMEEVGLTRVARQWGAIIQQFTDEERAVRTMGPAGQWLFPTLTPEGIQGNIDFKIDVASTTQTETVAKEQAMMLFQTLAPALPQGMPKLAQDLLEAFGKKDFTPYILGSPDLMMLTQMFQAQQSGGTIVPGPWGQEQPGQEQQGEQPSEETG
jgi:hypothetical protein